MNPNIDIEFNIYGENAKDFLNLSTRMVAAIATAGVSASGRTIAADMAVLTLQFEPDVHPSIPVLWVENVLMQGVARTNVEISSWVVTNHGVDVKREVETA
jgi:hypothetical protein